MDSAEPKLRFINGCYTGSTVELEQHNYRQFVKVEDEISALRLLVATFQEQNLQNLKDRTDSLKLLEDEIFLDDEIQERNMKNLKVEVDALRTLVGAHQEQNNTRIQNLCEFSFGSILLIAVYLLV